MFWILTPRSRLKDNRRFGGTCFLHFESVRLSQAETSIGRVEIRACTSIPNMTTISARDGNLHKHHSRSHLNLVQFLKRLGLLKIKVTVTESLRLRQNYSL